MKILAIIGTPTRQAGFTTQTVDALARSLRARGQVEIESIHLEDVPLARCQGFLSCVKHGEHKCPVGPQMASILAAMRAADGVIFASPVHCFNVSTLMKNFIDLLVYQMHRPEFFGKKALVVTSAAGAGHKAVLKYLRKTVAIWGFEVVGQLGTHAGLFGAEKYQARLHQATDKVADRFLHALARTSLPEPGIAELINFRVWRSVVKRTAEASPYDWAHWQKAGWLEQDYYYPAKPGFFSSAAAGAVEKIIERTIRTAGVSPLT